MEWVEARKLIEKRIKEETNLNTGKSRYRFVKHRTGEGFVVSIGKDNYIRIPWEMLRQCFEESVRSDNRYDGDRFRTCYPEEANVHPCYVHTIGRILVRAGLAVARQSKWNHRSEYYELRREAP